MLTTVTVDIGTTSLKLSVFSPDGAPLASASLPTPTVQDPWGEIYDVPALLGAITDFIAALDSAGRAAIQRIAITGVGESGGLVRPDLSLASPMILWHDQRGGPYLDHLNAADRLRIYEITGLPANPNYGLSKVAWAVDHSDSRADAAQWLNIAEYVAATMSGERWSEYTLASRTMALDLRDGHWSAEVCELLGLDPALFPALRSAAAGLPIRAKFARASGVSTDVHIHIAGHDHIVGGVGAGLKPGELLNSTGTTEGLLLLGTAPKVDAATAATKLANGISSSGTDYTLFASIPTGGSAFATLQRLLGTDAATLTRSIAAAHDRYLAGTVHLDRLPLVLPQFRGSPPPEKNAAARGVISGISADTTTDDLVLACFIGMAVQFQEVLNLFGHRPEAVKVIGPASRNPLWLQLKADLLGIPLSVSAFPEVVSRGAQALASGECGAWSTTDPFPVFADTGRTERLTQWRDATRTRWEHMKAVAA